MEGSGYNDPAKLKAALELAQSFKKGGSAKEAPYRGKGGSSTGGGRPQPGRQDQGTPRHPNQSQVRQEQHHERPERPPLNVPPPSQRSYTNTLASGIFKIGPGPILGTKAADFLGRQDHSLKREVSSSSEVTREDVMSNYTKPDTKKAPLNLATAEGFLRLRQSTETKTPVSAMAREEAAPVIVKLPPISTTPVSDNPKGSQPLMDTTNTMKQAPKADTVDSSFSLMDEDSAEARKRFAAPPAAFWLLATDQPSMSVTTKSVHQPKEPNQSRAPSEVEHGTNRASSSQVQVGAMGSGTVPQKENLHPKATEFIQEDISQGHISSEVGHGAYRSSSPQIQTRGKGNVTKPEKETIQSERETLQPERETLRPKAAEFIQKNTSSKNIDEGTTSPAIRCADSKLSPAAQEWAPAPAPANEIEVQFPNMPLHDCIVPAGQSTGHLVSITPVQFTDGRIVPGISTGQLYLQTPVNVTQGTNPQIMSRSTTPNLSAFGDPPGVSYRAPTPVPPTSSKSTAAERKPTQGLKASIWATK